MTLVKPQHRIDVRERATAAGRQINGDRTSGMGDRITGGNQLQPGITAVEPFRRERGDEPSNTDGGYRRHEDELFPMGYRQTAARWRVYAGGRSNHGSELEHGVSQFVTRSGRS